MPEIEQLIHDWTDRATAEAAPVTVDEIRTRIHPSDAASTDHNVVTLRPRPFPLLTVAAAIVALVAIVGGALAFIGRDDTSPVATESSAPFEMTPVVDRLLSMVPQDESTSAIEWNDLAAARDAAGVMPPAPDASDDAVRAHLDTVGRVQIGLAPYIGWPPGTGDRRLDWWRDAGIDPTRLDGWITWGDLPAVRLVAVGSFSPDEVDAALRANSGSGDVVIAEHREIATYAWGEDDADDLMRRDRFPGYMSMRLAVTDDTLMLARSTAALHELIDRHLDGGPSLRDRTDVLAILDVLGHQAQLGAEIWPLTGDATALGHIIGAGRPDGSGRRVIQAVAVVPDQSAPDVAARLEAAIADLLDERLADDPDSWLADITISVDVEPESSVIAVVVSGRPAGEGSGAAEFLNLNIELGVLLAALEDDPAPATTSLADGTYVMAWDSYQSDPLTITLGNEEHMVRFVPGQFFGHGEADAAAMEDGYTSAPDQLPNNYYIRDLGLGPVALPVSADVTPVAYEWPDRFFDATWDDFAAVYDGELGGESAGVGWWPLEVVVLDNRVVELRQFYLP